mmetsp:Transcript_68606/g.146865  ORF Transcript_68606/g.146865 Transcript_68606/m.146865 type:complete len:119 (-) Transcript_68606:59-415(-)
MAKRITCLVCALVVATFIALAAYTALPEPEAFVGSPSRLSLRGSFQALGRLGNGRGERTAAAAERRERRPNEFDEQYGKPPPTEAPFATGNQAFVVFSVFIFGCLAAFVVFTTGGFGQ